ncbi:MAG TPA: hypothetical protein PKZ12_05405, partial [Smithellaceae bacterium]|nr:hypothetical protein [Smithellaceae bacterium]
FADKSVLTSLSSRFDAVVISAFDKTTLYPLLEKIEELV